MVKPQIINADVLASYEMPENMAELNQLLVDAVNKDRHKIVVLDDDPTGVQTVHDVSVYTNWEYESIKKGFDFIVVNFANGDMVGHTGDFEAGIKAVECVDSQIGKILECAKEEGYSVVLTSDHGNCEEMKDEDGNTLTNHTIGDVWCFVMDKRVKKLNNGTLANVAPTILKLLNLPIPPEMQEALF